MTIEAVAMGEHLEHDHYCEGCSLIEAHACQCSRPDRLMLCRTC